MNARKPNLTQIGSSIIANLHSSHVKGFTPFIDRNGMESILNLTVELRIVKFIFGINPIVNGQQRNLIGNTKLTHTIPTP